MKDKKYIFQYHKEVWSKAKKDTDSYFRSDWKSWIGGVISAIVAGYLTAYFSKFVLGENMPNFWITTLLIIFSTVFGLAFFIVVVLGWNSLWKIPAELFKEKENKLELYTWNTAPISLQHFDIASGETGWAVRIENNKVLPMSAISKPVEVSSKGRVLFNEKGKWAFFRFINRRDGLTRERITSLREIRNGAMQQVFPFEIQPNEYLDFVLTRYVAPEQSVFETDQDKINASPKNSILKMKVAAKVMFEDMEYDLPTKTLEICFDGDEVPEIVSSKQEEA